MLAAPSIRAEQTYLVIISGLGGDETHREHFHEWALAMRDAALNKSGLSEDKIFYLSETPERAPGLIYGKSTKENIAALFEKIQAAVVPGDQLYVLLIGHGSFLSEQSRFNLPGPDLSAEDFDALLKPFTAQQIVFVNATSASGSFLPVLSGRRRIVVTATKSGYERNESQFGKYFVEAYSGNEADTDKNERVSVLEAYAYALNRVGAYYQEENILQTEHAMLDDDGDGEGAHDPGESEGDLASTTYLMGDVAAATGLAGEAMGSSSELEALIAEKRELESRVVTLRDQKSSMPEDLYLQELETVLLELAEVTERIEERRAP